MAPTLLSDTGSPTDQAQRTRRDYRERAVRWSPGLADQLIVLRVGANPKPEQAVRSLYSERSVMQTNSRRPETPDLLEVEGRMLRISLEQLESLVRKFSDAGW